MTASYWQLLALIAPVFVLIALGAMLRRLRWLTEETDTGLLRLLVYLLTPCLVLKAVLGNATLRDPSNLAWPPLVGFAMIALGFAVGYYAGRGLGLHKGTGLRTFAFAVGIFNYGFIPMPLVESLYGRETLGVLLVENVGCELAVWTVGLLVLSGLSLREGWRKAVNPVSCTLLLAAAFNLGGIELPAVLMNVVDSLGACAIPLGLLLCGATMSDYFDRPRQLYHGRTTLSACFLRLGVLPVLILLVARFMPFPVELKRVLVVQAAMPSGLMPLLFARLYGGQPLTAARIIIGTTALGVLVIPWWLRFGMAWVGV